MYVAGTDVAPRAFRNIEQPDQIDPNRRLEPGAPVVEAYLGGRHVFLARPEQRHGDFVAEGPSFTVPLTVSRMRRAYDIERDRATARPNHTARVSWTTCRSTRSSAESASTLTARSSRRPGRSPAGLGLLRWSFGVLCGSSSDRRAALLEFYGSGWIRTNGHAGLHVDYLALRNPEASVAAPLFPAFHGRPTRTHCS